jgi:hypothetical protein
VAGDAPVSMRASATSRSLMFMCWEVLGSFAKHVERLVALVQHAIFDWLGAGNIDGQRNRLVGTYRC